MSERHPELPFPRWLAALAVIVFVAMGLRIVYAAGFIPVDDAEYARAAARMLDGTFSYEENPGPPVNPGRTGIVLPLMALFKVFGPSETSLAAYPLAVTLLTILLVYAFAARMFGRYAALIAAGIWSFVPLDVEFAAKVNPDTAVTAFGMLGIFLIYVARLRNRDESGDVSLLLRGACAGLAFGVAWLCKASTAYLAPFCLILLCYDLSKDWRRYAFLWSGVCIGSLLVFGSEMAFYAAAKGNALYRFHMIETNYQLYPQFFFNEGARWGYEAGTPFWKAVAKRLLLEGPSTFFLSRDYMYLPFFGLIASAYALYKKDSRFYFQILLFGSLLFMFNFFSASLESYQPLPLFTRYSHSLAFVGAVLTGGLLSKLMCPSLSRSAIKNRPEGLFWGAALTSIIVIAAGWSTFRLIRDTTTTWSTAERELAKVIGPEDRIYTDPLSRAGLEFFWKYPLTMNVIDVREVSRGETVGCGSYVLTNDSYTKWLVNNYGMWYTLEPFTLPEIVRNPPAEWERSWSDGNATLYHVGCNEG